MSHRDWQHCQWRDSGWVRRLARLTALEPAPVLRPGSLTARLTSSHGSLGAIFDPEPIWMPRFLLLSTQFWSSCHGSSVVRSTTRDPGDSGSNPALSQQWSRDYPIDVPATPRRKLHHRASFCPLAPVKSIGPPFVHWRQSRALTDCSSFCPLSSSGQEMGCFGWSWGCFKYLHIPKRGVQWLSKEQGLVVVFWTKRDPIWAKWDPFGQFVRKVGKSALEFGKNIQSFDNACPGGATDQWFVTGRPAIQFQRIPVIQVRRFNDPAMPVYENLLSLCQCLRTHCHYQFQGWVVLSKYDIIIFCINMCCYVANSLNSIALV